MAEFPPNQQRPPQPPEGTVAVPPSSGTPSFDDVSKLFSLPIAEAANIIGVCTSVLKRICRSNGIGRWPYRKFLAGKTVEEIKRDAAREKSMKLAELSRIAKKNGHSSYTMPSTVVGLSTLTSSATPDISKFQRTSALGQPHDNGFLQYKWANMIQSNQTKNVPSYMDDFKYGFPSKGLSPASIKWWSSELKEIEDKEWEQKEIENKEREQKEFDDKDVTQTVAEPSAMLCSLRKEAVEIGRRSLLKGGISKRCGTHKLGKRQRLLLLEVFGLSLPDEWNDMLT